MGGLNEGMQKGITFSVNEAPMAQPRPKARRIGAGIQIYTPNNKKVKDHKTAIATAYAEAAAFGGFNELLEGPLRVRIDFIMKRPADMLSVSPDDLPPHVRKPDVDNLAKAVLDALSGVAWKDDSQVWDLSIRKFYEEVELGGKSGRKKVSKEPRIEIVINFLQPKT
jgi:crossover junction endodeoxyribonuclease RusA